MAHLKKKKKNSHRHLVFVNMNLVQPEIIKQGLSVHIHLTFIHKIWIAEQKRWWQLV